jgi:hypothetical protein
VKDDRGKEEETTATLEAAKENEETGKKGKEVAAAENEDATKNAKEEVDATAAAKEEKEAAKRTEEEGEATGKEAKKEEEGIAQEKAEAKARTQEEAEAKQKVKAKENKRKQTPTRSRRRRLAEAPSTVPDPTGVNVTIARNASEGTVLVTYGQPTFPFSSRSASTERSARIYPVVFHVRSGLLSQRDYVEFRPQDGSPAQPCIFCSALHAPLEDTGAASHRALKALVCDITGAALQVSPTLPRLQKVESDPVVFKSELWARCVSEQKKHLECVRAKYLTAETKWEDAQKRDRAKKKEREARREQQLATQRASEEVERVRAENEQLKRQHATDIKELRAAKRARTEVCQLECPQLRSATSSLHIFFAHPPPPVPRPLLDLLLGRKNHHDTGTTTVRSGTACRLPHSRDPRVDGRRGKHDGMSLSGTSLTPHHKYSA